MKAADPARGDVEGDRHYASGDTLRTPNTAATSAERGGGGLADSDSDSEGGESYQNFLSLLRLQDAKDAKGAKDANYAKDAKDGGGEEFEEFLSLLGPPDAKATRESVPRAKVVRGKSQGASAAEGRRSPEKGGGRRKRQEARADLEDRSSRSSVGGGLGGGGAADGRGRREEHGIARLSLSLPPGSHEVWKDEGQEEKVAPQHDGGGGGGPSLNLDWSALGDGVGIARHVLPQDSHMVMTDQDQEGEGKFAPKYSGSSGLSVNFDWSSLGDKGGSLDSKGRRAENDFSYFGLPPDSHDKWRDTEQEQKVMRKHLIRSLSDDDLLRRQIQLAEEARLELEEAKREAERKAQEAIAALEQERLAAKAREEEACRQAEEQAIRQERIRAHEEKQKEWKALNRDYPIPDYLKDYVTGVKRDIDEDAAAVRFFNIGLTGGTGTGKSSLIAKILTNFGAKPDEMPHISFEADGTTEPTSYVLPGLNERVRLWDLPGQGTESFPSKSYLRDMGLKYFDALLIATDGRWKCDDSMLVDAIRFAKIWFRVVRTKADLAVESGRYDHGISQEEALEQARSTLQEQLINVTDPDMIHLVTARTKFWTGHGGAPFGLVSTLCDELTGLLEDRG